MNRPIVGSWPPPQVAPPIADIPSLKEIKVKDQSGRTITSFEGRPSTWISQFSSPPRRVTQIKVR